MAADNASITLEQTRGRSTPCPSLALLQPLEQGRQWQEGRVRGKREERCRKVSGSFIDGICWIFSSELVKS